MQYLEIRNQVLDKNRTSGYVIYDSRTNKLAYMERADVVKEVKKSLVVGLKYNVESDTLVGVNGFKMSKIPRISKTKGLKDLGLSSGSRVVVTGEIKNKELPKIEVKPEIIKVKSKENSIKSVRNFKKSNVLDKYTVQIIDIAECEEIRVKVRIKKDNEIIGRLDLIRSSMVGGSDIRKREGISDKGVEYIELNMSLDNLNTATELMKGKRKVMFEETVINKLSSSGKESVEKYLTLFDIKK